MTRCKKNVNEIFEKDEKSTFFDAVPDDFGNSKFCAGKDWREWRSAWSDRSGFKCR
jgi:hypothetical protein